MEEKITIYDLIEKFKNISEGNYDIKDFNIKIKNNENENNITITSNNSEIYIDIDKNSVTIKNKDIDFYVYQKQDENIISKTGRYVKDNKHYFIYENGIQEENKEMYNLKSNNLLKQVHEMCYIGCELTTKKNYIYCKKSSQANEVDELNNDYIKIPVTDKLLSGINKFGNLENISKFKLNFIKEIVGEELLDLIKKLELSKITDKITIEFKELNEISEIYINIKDKLDIDENALNTLNNFIDVILSNPIEEKLYSLKNNVHNYDLKDIKELKTLKKDINEVIRLQRKENIKKLINKKKD